jgi:hypothetical protein
MLKNLSGMIAALAHAQDSLMFKNDAETGRLVTSLFLALVKPQILLLWPTTQTLQQANNSAQYRRVWLPINLKGRILPSDHLTAYLILLTREGPAANGSELAKCCGKKCRYVVPHHQMSYTVRLQLHVHLAR